MSIRNVAKVSPRLRDGVKAYRCEHSVGRACCFGFRKESNMRTTLTTILLAISVVMFMPARSSAESCWSYINHSFTCSGTGGCEGQEEFSTCAFGCISGTCTNNGGYGLCCGNHYNSAVISGNGAKCGACGETRTHMAKGFGRVPKSKNAVELSRGAPFRLPGLRFVPDRCAHSYAVIIDDTRPVHVGGE
jgi:hypothetical protein